jgi:hypothetical protein
MYEEAIEALEDHFGDQHLAAAYRSQLNAGTQKAGESLQEFATAIEQLAHRAYPALPEDHVRRKAGKAFVNGMEDTDVKIQLLVGGEKSVNEALRQALELQAVFLAARPGKTPWGNRSPQTRQRDHRQAVCWKCGKPGHFQESCHYGRRAEDNDRRGRRDDQPPRDKREQARWSEERTGNSGETNRRGCQLSGNERAPTEKGGNRRMH